ncbi:MAG: hypothetical protein AB7G13_27145 [Lautropia sp.]
MNAPSVVATIRAIDADHIARAALRRLLLGGLLALAATSAGTAAATATFETALSDRPTTASAGISTSFLSGSDAAFGSAAIRERRTGASLRLSEWAGGRHAIGVAAVYDYTRFVYHGLATRNRDLHRLAVPVRWRELDSGWQIELAPVIASSSNVFKDLPGRGSRRDIDLYGRAEYRIDPDHGSGWRVALHRDAASGDPRIYPAAALTWRDPRWRAALGWPSSWVEWRPGASVALGAAVFPDGGHWHVVSDERGGASFDYRVRTWRALLSAGWSPWQPLRLDLQAGIAFHRRHTFEDDTGAPIDRRAASARFWGLVARLRL